MFQGTSRKTRTLSHIGKQLKSIKIFYIFVKTRTNKDPSGAVVTP